MAHTNLPNRSRQAAKFGLLASAVVALTAIGAILVPTGETRATPPMGAVDGTPVVVELFTSQSCYSCPPAEEMLAELAQRDDLIALEHHVDYWDDLVYGSAGRWKDIFSSPEATERQRIYASVVPGRGNSYTPQMVIDGRYEAVGSRRGEVNRAIVEARQSGEPRLAIAAKAAGENGVNVRVTGAAPEAPAGIWLVRFLREHVTEVRAGENKGKTLIGRNVVREMTRIGDWTGGEAIIDLATRPDAGHGCAVIVQPDGQGPILGAAYCDLDRGAAS